MWGSKNEERGESLRDDGSEEREEENEREVRHRHQRAKREERERNKIQVESNVWVYYYKNRECIRIPIINTVFLSTIIHQITINLE
jgi:hypothetical protein